MDYYSATDSCVETVRALHQTIESLRTALERSRNEISDLKSKNQNFSPLETRQSSLNVFKGDKQLTTSKIVSYSNVFDGEKQVSSSNSLHINSLRKLEQKGIKKPPRKLPRFKEELIDSKSKLICSKKSNNIKGEVDVDKAKHLGHVIEAAINKISENRNKSKKKLKGKTQKDLVLNESETKISENIKTSGKNEQEKDLCKETKSKKQIEFSVEISKKPTKPININIHTKYKKKKSKMDDDKEDHKLQNDSKFQDEDKGEDDKFEEDQIKEENVVPPLDLTNLNDQENETLENEEVDDIELIFTTDETKETDFKEELVPIDTLLQCPLSDYDEKLSGDASDRELEDDVFNDNEPNQESIHHSKSDNSIHEEKSLKSYYSFQDSSFENKSLEKDESFDRFEEKVRIVETDISKIGIQDNEYNLGRRNTCPNPIQYRPILHREALGRGARKNRPFAAHVNVRKDSEAQTNISAIPGSSWRSESSLAHKVKIGDNFTTLPSKFPHPGSRLQLSEKTVEARRVLLSDIGFTSMVPELSRSADHLCPPTATRSAVPTSYGQFLRTTDLYSPAYTQNQRYLWTTTTPSDRSNSQSRYSSQFISSPPTMTRRCSAPVSPSKRPLKTTTSRVRFANGSLPELRTEWTTVDSGESTDSLVEEAEHYLRRSIDCLAPCHNVCFKSESSKTIRRASAPEPTRDNVPPQGWQPFLPRVPRDLHLDYWVKVITAEGRVRGGRVRYVGPLLNQQDSFVGVQLSTPDGQSDGTYNNRRYFNCEPYHGLFIPFKKIIMGWRP